MTCKHEKTDPFLTALEVEGWRCLDCGAFIVGDDVYEIGGATPENERRDVTLRDALHDVRSGAVQAIAVLDELLASLEGDDGADVGPVTFVQAARHTMLAQRFAKLVGEELAGVLALATGAWAD